MTNSCAKCCTDLDIRLEHLIFPDRMSADGQAFVQAHGLDRVTLGSLRRMALDLGDGIVKIPHRCQYLTPFGLCAIYEARPQICRDFSCQTRQDCTQCGGPHD